MSDATATLEPDTTIDGIDSETSGTDIAVLENRLKGLQGKAVNFISSLPDDTFDDKLRNVAIATNSVALVDQGDSFVFNLVHVVIQSIEIDGSAVPRIILVDENGQGYHAISNGVLSSLETLFGFAGQPQSWERPIPTRMQKVRAAKGTAFTLVFGS